MVSKQTLLIAEDEPVMRMAIQDALEPLENFELLEAVDGCEALQLIEEHQPALVILDLLMPKMGGIDVLETLQGRSEGEPRRKIVVLSALNQSQGGNYILERWQRHGRCKHQCAGSGL